MAPLIVDGFAGPGGWDEGIRAAGFRGRLVGIEWDEAACATARAAGHERLHADVAEVDPADYADADGLVMSPPCQAWSRSGKRGGIKDQPRVFEHLAACIRAGTWLPYDLDGWHDDRSPLVLQVMRWVYGVQPRWVACEQVEDVAPFWDQMCRWLRTQGYSAWSGVLNSEEFGVPQTRRRAILVARRDGVPAGPPVATHRRYYPEKRAKAEELAIAADLFETDLLPWISMAEALGWTGDIEMRHQRGRGMAERHGERPNRSIDAPAQAITGAIGGTGGTRLQWVVRTGNNSMSSSRTGSKAGEGGVVRYERPVTDPAPTLDTNVGGKWRLSWPHERPSTTVQGDPRIGRPGHEDREGGEAQFAEDSVRVSVAEAAILQGFRPDYPWAGNKGDQYRQVGDAVPPPLAGAVVAPLLPATSPVAA